MEMKIMRKTTIDELAYPVQCYKYFVKIWISVDGGENYAYCGLGKFFKTEQEAQEYAAGIKEEE